ncbi:MAG TPA: hypothetical protein DD706_12300 [Nitrospiraceae bacterium]|nr:hypothetical protein [Nitrospiraceae bacterium]
MEGPPFHVGGKEIHDLYEDQFTITLKESQRPKNEGTRLSAIDSLHQTVYVLEKIR